MKIVVGKDKGSYAFDKVAKTITFLGADLIPVNIEDVFLITNTITNDVIFQFNSVEKGGTLAANVLTLNYDTNIPTMSNTDPLQIIVEYKTAATEDTTSLIKTATESINTKEGTTGELASATGTRAAQLREIAEKAEANRVLLGSIDTDTSNIVTNTGNTATNTGDLDTKFGEVQATPTTNTLLGRLKDIRDAITSTVATISTIVGIRAFIYDDSGNQITSFGGVSGDTTGNNIYSTEQGDFTAIVTNATNNIILSVNSLGGESVTEANFLNGVLKVKKISDGSVVTIPLDNFTWTSGTKILDTTNCTNAFTFSTGDIVSLTLIGPDKSYDSTLDITKIQEQSPIRSRYTDKENLISSAQAFTGVFSDMGSEIDMRGYNKLGLWITVSIGTSTNPQIRVLSKHTGLGTEEYREISLGVSGTTSTINLNDYEVGTDANQLFLLPIEVNGIAPFLQIKIKDDSGGTGQITSAYITKAYV